MPFDADRYRDEFFKPRSRQKPLALGEDLLERYAICLPMPEAEIVTTIKSVRSFWNSQLAGTPMAKYAKLCLGDDERLKSSMIGEGHAKLGMMTLAWWEAQQDLRDNAASDRVTKLGDLLKDANGAYGVVTSSYLESCADRASLDMGQALKAAKHAGLEVVDDVEIPNDAPIGQYEALETDLGVAGISTIVELIHPDSGPFAIVERFQSAKDPGLHLDVAGIADQAMEASKKGTTPTWDARRRALNILRSAAEAGSDLRLLVLYHLVQRAKGGAVPGAASVKEELLSRGVVERDANILAVVLGDQVGTSGSRVTQRIEQLLQDGRLREAAILGKSLPQDGSDTAKQLLKRLADARTNCDALLAEARSLLVVPDEIAAAAKVREAEAISVEDAEELLSLVPLAPPRDLRLDVDGSVVRLHWQPNSGHTDGTTYRAVRSLEGPPKSPANGAPLGEPDGTSTSDQSAPVARQTFYAVFAESPGRPTSRPAAGQLVLVPPVLEPRCESGPDRVSAHWASHPATHHVEAVRKEASSTTPVKVEHNSATVAGLDEGASVHIQLTAVYETAEGSQLRSTPVVVSGTCRAAALPVETLKAQPIVSPTGVQVRFTWKPVDRSDVRLKRGDYKPDWPVGTVLAGEEMASWGTEVTGTTEASPSHMQLEAALPSGGHFVVPFSVGGMGIVVGKSVSLGVTDPVTVLTATPFSGFARLAWTWPDSSGLAEVSWERDDLAEDAVGLEEISRAVYDSHGVTVPLGSAPCEISVRALSIVDGNTYASPPASTTVETVSRCKLSYKVVSSPGLGAVGGRNKWLTVSADEDTPSVQLVMVAAPGHVMPDGPSDGVTLIDKTISLRQGQQETFSARVPRSIRKPFWVRCFITSGEADIVDPPLATLKED